MNRDELFLQIQKKKSFLCVGLDSDLEKIPEHLLVEEDPIFEFNKQIIDATHHLAVAYKPNIAFYECLGEKGWETLRKTINYIPKECFTIADAKRGDIGNTSKYYAKTFFEEYDFDSITVAPYMGSDSVQPFLEFKDKWTILLALTSNKGAFDFQFISDGKKQLFETVIKKSASWGTAENLMYVVGATKASSLGDIRKIIPDHFLLVPGVGAQGGSLEEVAKYGMNSHCGLLVNSSRGIIYSSKEKDFADAAAESAGALQIQMAEALEKYLD